ncbi:CD151 antigen-like [Mizuhopecten yessoensis]|uniref:Tetraspanin n=1 Tax=Mizuhopecten yessoensis TaxID=6573 RepID=A0A210QZR8_MIZYE|nr:CD151 antigen-like [Mizuhopecten yessoensis]OWF54165.1 Tetraspanin-11 [Mizuhopecten yessoensis]
MANCMKSTLLVFNIICLLAGLGVLGLGFWVMLEGSKFLILLEASLLSKASYMLIAVGGFISFISLIGCWGALTENRCLLGSYFTCLLLITLLQAAAAVLGFMFFDNVESYPDKYVGDAILKSYSLAGKNLVTTAIDTLQDKFSCCGYNSPFDWGHSETFNTSVVAVPISCCFNQNEPMCNEQVLPTKIHIKGCKTKLVSWLKDNVQVISAVSICVVFIQLIAMTISMCLCKQAGEWSHRA